MPALGVFTQRDECAAQRFNPEIYLVSIMSFVRIVPVLTLLALTHCTAANPSGPDPNNTTFSAKLDLSMSTDDAGAMVENPVGIPVSVNVEMIQTGPGTCTENTYCGLGTPCGRVCSGPDTAIPFTITSVACDDDLCDVVRIDQNGDGAVTAVTIVPNAGDVTLRVTGVANSYPATGSLDVVANCTTTPTAPNCH